MMRQLQLDDNAPWKQRFRAPVIGWTQLAKAAPDRGLATSNQSGQYQLYAWEVPTGELRQLTERPTGISSGWIAPDGRFVYYLDDDHGNEIGHYVRVPFGGGEPEDITPDLPPYSSWSLHLSLSGNRLGFTVACADGFHAYAVEQREDGSLPAPRLLFHSRKLFFGPVFSYDGGIAVVETTERAAVQHYNLLAFDVHSGELLAELWDGEGASVGMSMFSPVPGDERLLATTNRTGLKRPLLWKPRTGERFDLPLPELPGEIYPVDWSADGRHILLGHMAQAIQQLYIYDLPSGSLTRLEHPGGTFTLNVPGGTYFAPDGEVFAQWQDATNPPQLIALDGATGARIRTVLIAQEDVPQSRPWQSVSFLSSDGESIQGWLAVPEGEGPFPTILHTHGGPEAEMTEVFYPAAQSWLDHGFAFLTINYRGSTTFGRAFQEKIWGNPGHWEVEDIAAAGEWLVREGIARPEQIFLTGWSYGGFNTLMALGKRPELWAGGMAGVAITDWAMLYEDSADTIRGYQLALFGGTPEEMAKQYAASSPITYAEHVRAPVFIIQGRHDTRTPARPVAVYEARLKELGKPIEVHWFEAGHTGAGLEEEIRNQERFLRFAYKVLGEGG
jgi:dipeptidyl aminopeptidase/acylaminoacyl peptidase